MSMTPGNENDEELLVLLGGDLEFARKIRAVRECRERLEEDDLATRRVARSKPGAEPRTTPEDARVEAVTFTENMLLGDYTLLRLMDQGGMGVVYEAWDNAMNRRVALKLLRSGVILTDSSAMARFRREARLPSSLNHPGICTVYDAGVVEGTPYIAMAYLEGETLGARLSRRMEEQGAEPRRATPRSLFDDVLEPVQLIERVARSLHFFHESGLVHRDIKPTNIMITPEGDPVILDFGLARTENAEASTITHTGDVLGTPVYIAPEQISGKHAAPDRRCDIYSLGVTLYEYLTGQLPFNAPTRERLFQQILTAPPPDPKQFNPRISRELQLVLETALEKDPVLRYPTALDFAEDLRRVRCHETIRARPTSLALRLGRWVQRNPVLTAFVLSLNVFLIVALSLLGLVIEEASTNREFIAFLQDSVSDRLQRLWGNEETRFARITAEERSILRKTRFDSMAEGLRVTYGVYAYNNPIHMLETWGSLVEAFERELSKEMAEPVLVDFVVFRGYEIGREEFIKGQEVDFMRLGPASWVAS